MKSFSSFLTEAFKYSSIQKHEIYSGHKEAIQYGKSRKAGTFCAIVGWRSHTDDYLLFRLNSFDRNYVLGTRLKAGEEIFRYVSKQTMAGKSIPFIKVNKEKGLVYVLTQKAYDEDIIEFEKKGEKIMFFNDVINPESDE